MGNENQTGARAVIDTSQLDAGEAKYIATLDHMESKTQTFASATDKNMVAMREWLSVVENTQTAYDAQASRAAGAFSRLNPAISELDKSLSNTEATTKKNSKSLIDLSVSARDAQVAMYGAADAIELLGGQNLTPAIRNIEGIGQMLGAIGAAGAVGFGAIAVGTVIGAGIVEGLKRGGLVSPDTQGADVTAKQIGAMAASQGQFALTYITSLGDVQKATEAANKTFVNASVSLGVMNKETSKLISEAQGWSGAVSKISVTYRDLTGDAEQYAKAMAKAREQDEKRNSIIEKYSKKQVETERKNVDDVIKAEDEYYANRAEAAKKYGISIERMEEAHQRAMFQKQAQYAMSMSDAIGSRDAIAASRIARQYELDRSNAEAEHSAKVRQQSEDAANELDAMSDKFLQANAIRYENYRAEIDALAESKREELAVFQASLDAEKAAREQYAKDIEAFWAQQQKKFPMTQPFPNFNVPMSNYMPFKTPTTSDYAGTAATTSFSSTEASASGLTSGINPKDFASMIMSLAMNAGVTSLVSEGSRQMGVKLGQEIRGLFDESVLSVLASIFGDAAR